MRRIVGILLFLCVSLATLAHPLEQQSLPVLSRFNAGKPITLSEYTLVTRYAASLARSPQYEQKGLLLMDTLSLALAESIRNKTFCECAADLQALTETYNKFGFNIQAGQRPNDIIKLLKYAREMRFEYIYSRFKEEPYFWPLILVLLAYSGFAIANYVGKINWSYRKQFTQFTIIAAVAVLLITFCTVCFVKDVEQFCPCEWSAMCL